MPQQQAKNWCFTLNNYTQDEQSKLQAAWDERAQNFVRFLVFGRETGESGTPHLQGFISFSKRRTLATVKGLVSSRAHLEVARGSPSEASEYCKKDGDFEEFGTLPAGKGSRTDLSEVARCVREGKRMREIAEEHPEAVLRYGSGIIRLRQLYRPQRAVPPEIHVFWGKPGIGKTRRVWEFADPSALYVHSGERWFDGYDAHPSVLFDDFDGGWFKLTYLLKLLDRYVFQVPVKGGYTWWAPTHIFITSNIDPKEWYQSANEDHQAALQRRLNEFGSVLHLQ